MRSQEVHQAMIHGATRFELCQLVMRGVRSSPRDNVSTPRDCIGFVLHGLAKDPTAVTDFRTSCLHPGPLEVIAHANV